MPLACRRLALSSAFGGRDGGQSLAALMAGVPEAVARQRLQSDAAMGSGSTVLFNGRPFRYVDPTAKGFMSLQDALASGMPESLYRCVGRR